MPSARGCGSAFAVYNSSLISQLTVLLAKLEAAREPISRYGAMTSSARMMESLGQGFSMLLSPMDALVMRGGVGYIAVTGGAPAAYQ